MASLLTSHNSGHFSDPHNLSNFSHSSNSGHSGHTIHSGHSAHSGHSGHPVIPVSVEFGVKTSKRYIYPAFISGSGFEVNF